MMDVITWIMANWQAALGALTAILGGLVGLFLLIPGEQPEKALQWVVDMLKKISL